MQSNAFGDLLGKFKKWEVDNQSGKSGTMATFGSPPPPSSLSVNNTQNFRKVVAANTANGGATATIAAVSGSEREVKAPRLPSMPADGRPSASAKVPPRPKGPSRPPPLPPLPSRLQRPQKAAVTVASFALNRNPLVEVKEREVTEREVKDELRPVDANQALANVTQYGATAPVAVEAVGHLTFYRGDTRDQTVIKRDSFDLWDQAQGVLKGAGGLSKFWLKKCNEAQNSDTLARWCITGKDHSIVLFGVPSGGSEEFIAVKKIPVDRITEYHSGKITDQVFRPMSAVAAAGPKRLW